MLQQVIQRVNEHSGVAGPTKLPSGADVQGKTVTGLAEPTSPTDAISAGHAKSQYSAGSLAPQLDIGGSHALKGLTGLQLQFNSTFQNAQSGTVPLAKLTSGGTQGSYTVTNGVITAIVLPT